MLWVEEQAGLLRAARFDQLDCANLSEEIEDLARSERKAVKNNLVIVLLHLFEYQFQPARRASSWAASIVEQRQRLRDDLEESPSLGPCVRHLPPRLFGCPCPGAGGDRALSPGFPADCQYSLEQTLDRDFLPD